MTGSFMLCCRKLLSHFLHSALLLCLLASASANADGITVNKAELRYSDEGYQLIADFDVNLNFAVQQALSRGVPIYFVSEFTLARSRWYWLDQKITRSEQVTKLSYSVLTGQYRISRGALFQNFDSLEHALLMLRRQSSITIPADLINGSGGYIAKYLKPESRYFAGVRMVLDIGQLPKLLQVNALTSQDWDLDSGWYRWLINPLEIAMGNAQQDEEAE